MASHNIQVEVQQDFLEKITKAKPLAALAELVWNSLDADARNVDVQLEYNNLGSLASIVIQDDGTSIPYENAEELFGHLGGSWKRDTARTSVGQRFLHGQEGKGRFKAFALGAKAAWHCIYEKNGELWSCTITMNLHRIQDVTISEEERTRAGSTRGTIVRIGELNHDYRVFSSSEGVQELAEYFAIYLMNYRDVVIRLEGQSLDPEKSIVSRTEIDLDPIEVDGKQYTAKLEVIEWRSSTQRTMYLCSEEGFPLLPVSRHFHVGHFQFSAYLKSGYVTDLQQEGALELYGMNPTIKQVEEAAYQQIKTYFRDRAAQNARRVVDDWKADSIYPYEGEATSSTQKIERQVFDIVASNVAEYIPNFDETTAQGKALHLRLLRQAIENSPDDLQYVFGEVLKLPKRKLKELASLLQDVQLTAIINSVVADRLKFLAALEAILFDVDTKKRLKERSQLHKIVEEHSWLFGEQYALSVSDQSLTEVLRKHKEHLGESILIDEPVRHVNKKQGIVDLMLSRSIPTAQANNQQHLIVELKAPRVKLGSSEIAQIKGYAYSVAEDERFRGVQTKWTFWLISDDYDRYVENEIDDEITGRIHRKKDIEIFIRTWAQILNENRARLQFFKEKLEYQADKGASLEMLRTRYDDFLKGVFIEEESSEQESDNSEVLESVEEIG